MEDLLNSLFSIEEPVVESKEDDEIYIKAMVVNFELSE